MPAYMNTQTEVGKMRKENSRDDSWRPIFLENERDIVITEKRSFWVFCLFVCSFFKMGEIQICFYAKEKSRESGCLKVQKREGVVINT